MNPAGGAGAQTAIQDAIALANWICAVQSRDMDDIEAALKEYQTERVPIAKETFETSRMFTNIAGKVMRCVVVKLVASVLLESSDPSPLFFFFF